MFDPNLCLRDAYMYDAYIYDPFPSMMWYFLVTYFQWEQQQDYLSRLFWELGLAGVGYICGQLLGCCLILIIKVTLVVLHSANHDIFSWHLWHHLSFISFFSWPSVRGFFPRKVSIGPIIQFQTIDVFLFPHHSSRQSSPISQMRNLNQESRHS